MKKWKFLRMYDNDHSIYSDYKKEEWKIGEWRTCEGYIKACKNGYHCSDTILDALRYVKGEVLAKVEVRGDSDTESDKSAWREMRIIEAYRWNREDSIRLAIYSAEKVISIYEAKYPEDKRPRYAIKAAKEYLKNPNENNARAAADAADAAYAAAYAAVYAAAYAADAADAKATSEINRWLKRHVKNLRSYDYITKF